MDDLISRQAAIDIVSGYAEQFNGYVGSPNDSEVYAYARGLLLSIERNINAVPSAQPKHGRWIPIDGMAKPVNWLGCYKCSICGSYGQGIQYFRYCNSCGARMDEEEK